MPNIECHLELQHLTKTYRTKKTSKKVAKDTTKEVTKEGTKLAAKDKSKSPGRSEFHSRPGPLRPFGAQWRRQKHHDEYHHRESGRYQRKGTVER